MPSKRSSAASSPAGEGESAARQRWSKPLEWLATRALLRLLIAAGRVTPRQALPVLGSMLGGCAYACMPRYRLVALANLRRAYGHEWDERQIRAVALASFRHLGTSLIEFFLRQPRITGEEVEREVRFEGQEHYEAALARGRGVVLITAHYGNWEIMGPRLVRAGYRVSAISRVADDPGTESLIEGIRSNSGYTQIPRRLAARQGLAVLRRNEILAVLLDQNTLEGGVFVPFFGLPASTATGPAVFALKTGAALIPTFSIRMADGSHLMRAWPPIYPACTGNRDRDIRDLTARVTSVIEQQVRERPELWCWLHNRWKRQPLPGEGEYGAAEAVSARLPREEPPLRGGRMRGPAREGASE